MVKAKKWILAEPFQGEPKFSNFRLVEEELSMPQDGEFLCEAIYLSVDPFVRVQSFPVNSVVIGAQVARVIESQNNDYPVGCLVQMFAGWRSRTLVNPKTAPEDMFLMRVPELEGRSPSIVLGILGEPGMSAYFGFLDICRPKEGETVLVSSAAGAVGNVVGQIAKIKGCKVIGFTGSNDKCDWLKGIGFDHVFNYKKTDVDEALNQAAPDGIDCYFDNVGGDFAYKVLSHMKSFGRVSICGAVSTYNHIHEQPKLPLPFVKILGNQLKVEGFIVRRWLPRFQEGKEELLKWLHEGKLIYKETVFEGFENMPEIFMSVLKGANIGKMIVKV